MLIPYMRVFVMRLVSFACKAFFIVFLEVLIDSSNNAYFHLPSDIYKTLTLLCRKCFSFLDRVFILLYGDAI